MRTQFLCNELDQLNIKYFREPFMNIVTIHAEFIPKEIAEKYHLVPETHNHKNNWYKIVLMNHVEVEHNCFLSANWSKPFMLKKELRKKYKELRQQLTEDTLVDKSLAIANRILQLDVWDKTYYHLFLTIEEQKKLTPNLCFKFWLEKTKKSWFQKVILTRLKWHIFYSLTILNSELILITFLEPVNGLEVPVDKIEVGFCATFGFWFERKSRRLRQRVLRQIFIENVILKWLKLGCLFLKQKKKFQTLPTTMYNWILCYAW